MPWTAVIRCVPMLLAEQAFEERQLMQADDDGMLERFIESRNGRFYICRDCGGYKDMSQ